MAVTLDDIKQLFRTIIIPFHTLERDMPLPLPNHRPDNDAEHSWSLSFLAISIASEIDPTLDVGKVSIFATVHDLVEVYAGDTSVWADAATLASKSQREQLALQKLRTNFPHFPSIFRYIDEYEARQSNEAKFVYALDKFINLLTIVEDNGYYYREKYKITKAQYQQQLVSHKQKAHSHPAVGKYYDELRALFDTNPEHFYSDQLQ
jgi:5'-deoxynucleotidase YfbR-like HD superfamily hydrolase